MARKRNSRNGLVVGSKVREFVRGHKCYAASDLLEALNRTAATLLGRAVERARSNKRKTVRSCDL